MKDKYDDIKQTRGIPTYDWLKTNKDKTTSAIKYLHQRPFSLNICFFLIFIFVVCFLNILMMSEYEFQWLNAQEQREGERNIELAVVMMTAARNSTKYRKSFEYFLRGFSKLTKSPDLFVMYEDWGATPAFREMLHEKKDDFTFPIEVVARPGKDQSKNFYPSHYYHGSLRMFWWFVMNDAFKRINAKQICFMEDDVYLHPDFFAWLEETNNALAASNEMNENYHWGIYGWGAAVYVPLCVSRFEWSVLLHFHQHFCWKEDMAWDIVLYSLHQHGPLPAERVTSTKQVAAHVSIHVNDDEKENLVTNMLSNSIKGSGYLTQIPYYRAKAEAVKFVDLNYEFYVTGPNRADTKTQLWKYLDNCVEVALDTKRAMDVDKRLQMIRGNYTSAKYTDIKDHDIATVDVGEAEEICDRNMDCFGFVEFGNKAYLKGMFNQSHISHECKSCILFTKGCSRATPTGLCIPKFYLST